MTASSASPTTVADLPPLPPLLLVVLARYWTPLMQWLEHRLVQRVLARCRAHPLVRLDSTADLTPVIHACAAFHHRHGPGAPPTYSVAILVRAELLRAWYGALSDRQLEHLLTTDLLARWFVGLALWTPAPDHTTLSRFHAWMTIHHPQTLFDQVLALLDRTDPEVAPIQVIDTFALATPATPVSPRRIIATLTGTLAQWWITTAPVALQAALPPLDLGPLLQPPRWRSAAGHARELVTMATTADQVITALTPHLSSLPAPLQPPAQHLLTRLQTVLHGECWVDPTTAQWAERPAGTKGTFRMASLRDPEATFRIHGPQQSTFGYNAAIMATPTRIRSMVAATGSTPDPDTLARALTQQIQRGDPAPSYLIADQAFGWGQPRTHALAVTNGITQVVAEVPTSGGHDHRRFGPADFRLRDQETCCICPAGVQTDRRYRAKTGDGVMFRFLSRHCRGCALWDACRDPRTNPRAHRTVFIATHYATLRMATAFNTSPEGQRLLANRWWIEPTIAWVVRYAGGRRSRRVGQAAAQYHLWQAGAVTNLRRWLRRMTTGHGQG